MTESAWAGVTVLDHPLARDKIARIRDARTQAGEFRALIHQLSLLTAYVAFARLTTVAGSVQTPLAVAPAERLREPGPVVVGILRSGLAMVDSFVELVPEAAIGHIGLRRDHDTHIPHEYLVSLPPHLPSREVVVVDPMLATGGSAIHALDVVKRSGAQTIHFACLFAAPEGIEALRRVHADVPITVASLEDGLSDEAYILPGIGDAGDRLFGTE